MGLFLRKVDELVKALGMTGISKSRVSTLCEELDEEVGRFRNRPLEGAYPYVWIDATYVKARQDGRVVSMAVVIAVGVKAETGEREVLGLDVGPSEDGAFWSAFLRSLVARGLSGVRLVTSDAHQGLKSAIEKVVQGASWQRCRVHFMRNALSLVPKAAQQMVGATIRTVFAQPDLRELVKITAQVLLEPLYRQSLETVCKVPEVPEMRAHKAPTPPRSARFGPDTRAKYPPGASREPLFRQFLDSTLAIWLHSKPHHPTDP